MDGTNAYSSNPFEEAMRDEADTNVSPDSSAPAGTAANEGPAPTAIASTGSSAGPSQGLNTSLASADAGQAGRAGQTPEGDCACCRHRGITLLMFALGEILSLIAVIINRLDYCAFGKDDKYDVDFGMFEISSSSISSFVETDYYEICEDVDDDSDDEWCTLPGRGAGYLIFNLLSWIVTIFVFILYFVGTIKCCSGNCVLKAKWTPIWILFCGSLLIFALVTWDVRWEKLPFFVCETIEDLENGNFENCNFYDCQLDGFGWSNVLLVLAIVFVLSSVIHGSAVARSSWATIDR